MSEKKSKLMSVKEFCSEYGFGYNKGYEIVNSVGFPMIKCGRKIYIIGDRVDEWLYSRIGKSL